MYMYGYVAQTKDLSQFLVHWTDSTGHLLTGVMKTFSPHNCKFRQEVDVIRTLANQKSHPNIAQFHWFSSTNLFAVMIRDLTGDTIGPDHG